ncbi:ABC transporter ATP-binding protein [Microbacterium thalassium]|uniref:ABC-2 type transport system ATP-binding protein n=1 Tax=Microbacterium thalassium TaxID=362649 RepID=A0A7X0FTU3_9MICO|nr:ABC transporter ATP-binding protein [Microbacterium thalassium]MBB6392891.1 ABC-2 type transport system ATP-binding protein [Microbacterium thalassium]GLK22878.1 ABC transporter [Microbacterium thalassium]
MDENVVRVRNLRKEYGNRAVVDDVSFDIARGETFALLGPNGAGKTTTVEILEGFRRRTGGEVSVLGEDPGKAGLAWKARIGVVLQSAGEFGAFTVREQIRQFAGFFPKPRDVDEVIAAVGLEAQAGMRVNKLSGGQQRRVDVALGIVGSPDLLFLDEPTTGFDPQARLDFWAMIKGLSHDGTTILLTTHYLEEAAHLADRVGIIVGGQLGAIGPVDTIGGEDARTPIVRWTDAGTRHEQRTREPGRFVADLVARAGAEPADVEIVRPTLEDIYLDLVSNDDGAADAADAPVKEESR